MFGPPSGGAPAPDIFIIRCRETGNFTSFSYIKIYNAVTREIGTVKNCRRIKDGILVATLGHEQSEKILTIKTLLGLEVSVAAHPTLNHARGVIRHRELAMCTDDELLDAFQSQGVIAIYRFPRRGENGGSSLASLTFNTRKLPEYVHFLSERVPVSRYFSTPRRCGNCQRFGHLKASCTRELTCACGHPNHDDACPPPRCPNCLGPHRADDRECAKYQLELQVEKVRATEDISYYEARRKVQPPTPKGKSYSAVAGTALNNLSASSVSALVEALRPLLLEIVRQAIVECLQTLLAPRNPPPEGSQLSPVPSTDKAYSGHQSSAPILKEAMKEVLSGIFRPVPELTSSQPADTIGMTDLTQTDMDFAPSNSAQPGSWTNVIGKPSQTSRRSSSDRLSPEAKVKKKF